MLCNFPGLNGRYSLDQPESGLSGFDNIAVTKGASHNCRMTTVDADLLAQLPLSRIAKVTFYKRDEIATDLICCDVDMGGNVWTFHEELVGWDLLMGHLQRLPGFYTDWFGLVSQPTFAKSETVVFKRG